MLGLLLAVSLTAAIGAEAPAKGESGAQAEPAKPAKPARRKLPSPVVPTEEPGGVPAPVKRPWRPAHGTALPAATPPPSAPPGTSVTDRRLAQLETENAKLRLQLALAGASVPLPGADPAAALAELAAGNQRYVAGERVRTLLSLDDAALRERLAKGETPFAVLVTCSDSRLSESLLFDQEVGRLFAIREAGNALDNLSLGSVEYALGKLGPRLVVVLGHGDCGAVRLVSEAHGKPLPGNLWALQAAMSGLLEKYPDDPNEEASVHMAHLVALNAQRQAQALLDRSAVVRDLVVRKQVQVVPAVYDLASGRVTFLAPILQGAPKLP